MTLFYLSLKYDGCSDIAVFVVSRSSRVTALIRHYSPFSIQTFSLGFAQDLYFDSFCNSVLRTTCLSTSDVAAVPIKFNVSKWKHSMSSLQSSLWVSCLFGKRLLFWVINLTTRASLTREVIIITKPWSRIGKLQERSCWLHSVVVHRFRRFTTNSRDEYDFSANSFLSREPPFH